MRSPSRRPSALAARFGDFYDGSGTEENFDSALQLGGWFRLSPQWALGLEYEHAGLGRASAGSGQNTLSAEYDVKPQVTGGGAGRTGATQADDRRRDAAPRAGPGSVAARRRHARSKAAVGRPTSSRPRRRIADEPAKVRRGFVGKLRSYQSEALSWLGFLDEAALGGCLALDMGLGKTPTLLAHLLDDEERRTGARDRAARGRRQLDGRSRALHARSSMWSCTTA